MKESISDLKKRLQGKQVKTRFAPSPTGFLHLGHVASAIYVWGIAQVLKAEVILRIEDHDLSRSRPEYQQAIVDDLKWLGFITEDVTLTLLKQQHRLQSTCNEYYAQALMSLKPDALFYCQCSRKDIREHSKHTDSHDVPYPGTCENLNLPPKPSAHSLRLKLSNKTYTFDDLWQGPQQQNPYTLERAAILKDKMGQWSYQFAVVVDDIREGVNLVIRGTDLLSSTSRQLDIYHQLQKSPTPLYLHHPLITDAAGKKLSKRQLTEGIIKKRTAGVSPSQVLGEAAYLVGLQTSPQPITYTQLQDLFWNIP